MKLWAHTCEGRESDVYPGHSGNGSLFSSYVAP